MATQVDSGSPVSRPTGTVTLLFSDIEGSTERWEAGSDAMSVALARHDVLVRQAIESHEGFVFKTVGDAFCAAFARTSDALSAALDAQRALAREVFSPVGGIRVRMAINTGETEERDGDYFGPVVNRTARLLAIGHGGQVLVSAASADLLLDKLPPQCELRSLGQHTLKNLARPEIVYQLYAPELQEAFPALNSASASRSNLPLQLTSFVGRDEDLREIESLLARSRLVTMLGPGGIGKTRAAIKVGRNVIEAWPDGVWFVELASIASNADVAASIGQTFGLRQTSSQPPLETLVAFLKNKRLLLLLDNCEHVIDSVREVVGAVLRECEFVRLVSTSRETLRIAGETVFRLPTLQQAPAVALFADRARTSDSHFRLTDGNAGDVAEICRRLDGIPLAIELAAARVNILSPHQLLSMLDERFRVLSGGDRAALPRQQTMRAAIDWSYDLLSPQEQRLLRRLAIFSAGFTIATMTAVAAGLAADPISLFELLSSLVDKSLVQAEFFSNNGRYKLLESTRKYAREKLDDSGEYAAAARAHALAYAELADKLDREWRTSPDALWLEAAEPELENWRAALVWAFDAGGDAAIGQRLVGALHNLWSLLAAPEGRRWLRTAQESVTDETPAAVVAKLDLCEAQVDGALSQYAAMLEASERAVKRYARLDDSDGTIEAKHAAGSASLFLGRIVEGESALTEALALARATGARRMSGVLMQSLAIARQIDGDAARARTFFAEALTIFEALGADRQIATISADLAELAFQDGDPSSALRLSQGAVAALREQHDTRRLALALGNMSAYLVALERYDDAIASAREGLTAAKETGGDVFVAFALQHIAAVAALRPARNGDAGRDDAVRAARLLGYTETLLEELGAQLEFTERKERDAILAAIEMRFGASAVGPLIDEGRSWDGARALSEALLVQ
ncbi:MAG: adenylate/guanylate cyclase domain-containing protein [Candidatus Baltobacteraceae bacterium]